MADAVRDLCVFAHFDPDDALDPYVLHYLREIAGAGFEIVFVTTARISETAVAQLTEIPCRDVIWRNNVGHDFGSWAAGLRRWRARTTGRVLLANDSVYGPIGVSLAETLEALTSRPADVYGMVASAEIAPHLQSWFLLFEPHVVATDLFAKLYVAPAYPADRQALIEQCEVGGSVRLARDGFRLRALFEPGRRRVVANPTAFLWRQLVERDRVPFLKASILRDDPACTAPDVAWQHFLQSKDPMLCEIVSAHVARVRRNGPERPLLAPPKLSRRAWLDDLGARTGLVHGPALFAAFGKALRLPNDIARMVVRISGTRRRRAARRFEHLQTNDRAPDGRRL